MLSRQRPPTDASPRALELVGDAGGDWDDAAAFTRAARDEDYDRIAAWVDRAAAEGVLGGGDR